VRAAFEGGEPRLQLSGVCFQLRLVRLAALDAVWLVRLLLTSSQSGCEKF
jgi:hypothetical protein